MDPTPTASPCVITLDWLRSVNACDEQVDLFESTFGYSTEVTAENLEKAREVGLNLNWLAFNPATPPEALSRLAQDTDAGVRGVVAVNPITPSEVLLRLAQDTDAGVRQGVACNPTTPPEILSRLAQDPDEGVREGVARNQNTPPEALSRLAQDPDAGVRWWAARNPNTPTTPSADAGKES